MTENVSLKNKENNTTTPTKEKPYRRNLLIFGTSNFGRHLLETTRSEHTAGNDKLRELEKTHTTNIELILTYEMNQLKNNIKLKSTRNLISNSDIILIHILGNDVRLLTNKTDKETITKTLQKYINDLVDLITILVKGEKLVVLSLLLPRHDSTTNETTRRWVNEQLKTQLANKNSKCYTINYDNTIKKEDLESDGYHLTQGGFDKLINEISNTLRRIQNTFFIF